MYFKGVVLEVNIKKIVGIWRLGYSLDKHTVSSTPIGYSEFRRMQFNTVRSEAGEALFQLKYRADFSKVFPIAQQMNKSFSDIFPPIDFIIPMPSSRDRFKQLVIEIAKEFSRLKGVPFYGNLLVKTRVTLPVKDIAIKDDKISTLMEALFIHDILNEGLHDVLIIDDLFDTGSSLEAATKSLQNYSKIRNVYVATVTRKR